ncbi:unnamed protein product [Larinioides sclopetarius]|uniref:G patch domain-containing protein n=1 Tax=Larinioides sclopetarius TaxID=280406 RepID=A0AAV2B1H0_9ARAC
MRKFFSFYVRILLIFLICFTMEEDEDDYISFGTPLPEIEEESVLRKKAARELEVRDEKGRQRFHGAFTGGFSAGYFNTVGTKEGWTPSTFVSSRDKKSNDHRQQNPEDFMDEEFSSNILRDQAKSTLKKKSYSAKVLLAQTHDISTKMVSQLFPTRKSRESFWVHFFRVEIYN